PNGYRPTPSTARLFRARTLTISGGRRRLSVPDTAEAARARGCRSGGFARRLPRLSAPSGVLVSAAIRDVTGRRQAEERQRALRERLAQSNRDLEDFVAVAAHDLHEPLRKARFFGGRVSELSSALLDGEGREDLARMDGALERMQTLIDGLLTYTLISTEADERQAVDLGHVAQEVVADLAMRFEETGARLELGELPAVEANPTQMRQLLQ